MSSSDDESEAQLLSVSNYHFEDNRDAPVSFSVLPIQWSESESLAGKKEQVFLHGFADNGLQKIFMQVIAWRFDLSNVKPEISVLSKDGRWIKLQKPRKSFEDTIRTIFITLHFLHYVKKNPEISAKSLWDILCKDKELSSYEVMPSQNDLLDHMDLMREAAKRDAVLAKSKLLPMVLEEKFGNRKLSDEDVKDLARPGFIIDDIDNDMIDDVAEESDGEDELFDSVCAFCDNGGTLLCCDGKCMRSFHATVEDGTESSCVSLCFTQKEVDEIQNFYCKNCEYNKHQCFACGKLGSSDKFSGAEVFKCASATCGFFYHPHCVATLLHRVVEDDPQELERKIADGEPFTCPTHYCFICKEMENKKEHELQFAVCRRCPKSYHRKCLPRKIAFDDIEDEGIITRAWEGLLPNNRILIYCLKHEIDDELGTPIRDHIKFPGVRTNVREINITKEKMKPAMEERVLLNKDYGDLDNSFGKRAKVSKLSGKMSSGKVGIKTKSEKISGSKISRKTNASEASRRCLNENKKSISKETFQSDYEDNQPSLGEKLYALWHRSSEQVKHVSQVDNVANNISSAKPTKKPSPLPPLDTDSERRLLALYKEAASSITLESVLEKHKYSSTHTHSLKNVVEKTITVGKLEGSVDAVRTALRKLEDGHSIRDAEAVCDPDVLNRIFKWKEKLRVYLAPVLYGNRYTSYGRHFTQVEKLEGIADKLHCYVQNGDTIVDFCCGANDFSILMKKKLEETGKRCSYKNFDLLPTKNDFCFEMRDWMTVQAKELPTGSRLIMGLNPPFGVKAALANKFIDKALEFKPKLVILIVPPETERLDRKRSPYDLVWEDESFLSGKSFYLPGSVDVNDRQIDQWNVRPPPLYLWSRPDWTTKHKAIAQDHGHLFNQREVLKMDSFNNEMSPAAHTIDGNCGESDNLMLGNDLLKSTDDKEERASVIEFQRGSSSHSNEGLECHEKQEHVISMSRKTSRKRKLSEENDRRGQRHTSPAKRQVVHQLLEGVSNHSQSNPVNERSSVEGFQPKNVVNSPYVETGNDGSRHLETSSFSSVEIGHSCSGIQDWPNAASPFSDFGVTNFGEHQNSFLGDSTNSLGFRSFSMEDEKYLRESELRQQAALYGLQGPDSLRSNFLPGHDPAYGHMGSTYGLHGSVSESSYRMNTPAMERYAPRLDELKQVRMGSLGSETPTIGRHGTFEHSVPHPGYGSELPGFPPGTAASPYNVYSLQNSGGRFNM